ncbi:MAG: 2-oxoglutarate and iron-dependent oxygenase domain-containing protein [Paracoccaceae bacterium]|nr:2-oxoglutarate and iron-dependent oxygenase domain-containing protein [Paracoccaceae bacterium]
MSYAEAKKLNIEKVPVIDITSLRNGTNPKEVAKKLYEASTGLGFIYIKGHGISNTIINSLREDGINFFRRNDEQKQEVKVSQKHRGWLGYGGAKMKETAKADLKESFIWGYQDAAGCTAEDHPLRGKNQWPSFQPSLQNSAMEYFKSGDALARTLLKGFALGLNLPENFFIRTSSQPLSRASLVYYPSQPKEFGADQFGVSAHTDFGLLTILCQDNVGGLQIQDLNGDWFHAPPIPDTLIINVADLLARWTAGRYKSTPHRVVNESGKERMSIVLAFDPNPETLIDAKEIFGQDFDEPDVPISCGDYLIWRFNKAFSYRNNND